MNHDRSVSFVPLPHPPTFPPLFLEPYSGRYEATDQLGTILDLRVDIDVRYPNSPVMNCVSGDTYKKGPLGNVPLGDVFYRVYDKSWIDSSSSINMSDSQVEIFGIVHYWKRPIYGTRLHLKIPRSLKTGSVGPATLTLTPEVGEPSTYICTKKSDCFRNVTLEVDVTKSVNKEPILPEYSTDSHPVHPAGISSRILTVEKAYREAGICLSINSAHTIIDDTANPRWSLDELHDAMVTYFSKYSLYPRWNIWSMFCNYSQENPNKWYGVMFDTQPYRFAVRPGIEDQRRRGFAVFRGHWYFNNLVSNPMNNDQLWAMRWLLFAYVHEAGHAFNLLHPFERTNRRIDALSWMNYPHLYPTGVDRGDEGNAFFQEFRFMFDEEELVHMRHGDRAAVIMGGDPFGSAGHLEVPYDLEVPFGVMSQLEGQAPIELLLRSQDYFDYLEPIGIEIRVRNLLSEPVVMDSRLNPQFGIVTVFIRRPNGRIVQYVPASYIEGDPILLALESHNNNTHGKDRFSDYVTINYGKYGFYFDEPGEYLVRAIYQVGYLVPSNTLRIRVGYPTSNEESRIAKDFFSYEVGMSIYLNGSESPFLSVGKSVLESVSDKYKKTLVGAKISAVLAASEARPFFRIQDKVRTQTHKPNYDKALKLTEPAVEVYRTQKDKNLNIPYHLLVRSRADYLTKIGKKKEARNELSDLRKDLGARGVNGSVLKSIKGFEESIENGAKRSHKKGRRR